LCARDYEKKLICGEACWARFSSSGHDGDHADAGARQGESDLAEKRAKRRLKEQRAERAVTIGIWAVLLTIAGAIGLFVMVKMSDHSGEKLWEISGTGYSGSFASDPDSRSVLFASPDGTIKAIDSRTGETAWVTNLPEGERPWRPRLIDDSRGIVQSDNKIFLCSSENSAPMWELALPRNTIRAEPVVDYDNLYVASYSGPLGYSDYSSYGYGGPAYYESTSRSYSSRAKDDEKKEEIISTITAANIDTGETIWNCDLEGIMVGGLLVDYDRVYAVGSRPRSYQEYTRLRYERQEREESESRNDDELLGTTQLWALSATTGKPEWKLEGTGGFFEPPVMSPAGIVFATKQNIYLISPAGEIKWTYPLTSRYVFSIKPTDDTLMFSTSDGLLVCLDLESGEDIWTIVTTVSISDIGVFGDLVCVPAMVEVNKEPPKVIPTKRWKGSEDLLEKALKSVSGPELEPILMGLDSRTGETRWKLRKVEDEFQMVEGIVYAVSHQLRVLLMDASVDPTQFAKEISTLAAYDAQTGEKIWQQGIDGRTSSMKLAFGAILLASYPVELNLSENPNMSGSVRLVAIATH
jgi:outer membrane protein assembly factor BamB